MDGSAHPLALETLEIRTVGSEVVVYDTEHEQVHLLNRIAGEILRRCDGHHTPSEIAAELSERTGASLERVLTDVAAAIASFRELRFVQ